MNNASKLINELRNEKLSHDNVMKLIDLIRNNISDEELIRFNFDLNVDMHNKRIAQINKLRNELAGTPVEIDGCSASSLFPWIRENTFENGTPVNPYVEEKIKEFLENEEHFSDRFLEELYPYMVERLPKIKAYYKKKKIEK